MHHVAIKIIKIVANIAAMGAPYVVDHFAKKDTNEFIAKKVAEEVAKQLKNK